ncbi:uncharacterized protein LOC120118005 [Hibiscus syriacus]|uniref:uncharacterized protein LOC120118005 n=1 Tax=Hibiscus syriacus TaxID=106335 RepID=UPI0019243796|nr:uncharacterized protein LOC120118005 [Hibiscus syriacus]
MDWRKLFGSSTSQSLNYHPPTIRDGIPTINPPPEILEAGISEWKSSLVGQFLRPAPNFTTLERIVDSLWTKALQGSRVQEPYLKRLNFDLSKIPIWVHLFNVPLELYSQAGLSYIASGIGIPISMDSVTTSKTRLEFAKICVEIEVEDVIPKTLEVVLKDNITTSIHIEVPWLPHCCRKCKVFGHNEKICLVKTNTNPTQVWKRKFDSNSNSTSTLVEPELSKVQVVTNFDLVVSIHETINASNPNCADLNEVLPDSFVGCQIKDPASKSVPTDFTCTVPNEVPSDSNDGSHDKVYVIPTDSIPPSKEGTSVPKKVRGTPTKDKASFAGSSNRFEILNSVEDNYSTLDVPQRASRHASKGVAKLALLLNDCGDFNITLHPYESSDHELLFPSSSPEMKEFQEVSQDLNLYDNPFFGPLFTWSNKQSGSYLARKLDRVLINSNWATTFHNSAIEFLAPGVSDHCITMYPTALGSPMKVLFLKLKRLKNELKNLNNSCYNDLPSRVKAKKLELEKQQLVSLKGEDSFDKELQLQKDLLILEEAELMFLKQKAKVQWIKQWDRCTKYFHSAVAVKKKKDTIQNAH